MPRKYRYLGSAEVHIMAIEKVVQSGEVFESDIDLVGPFQEVQEAQYSRPEPDEEVA